MCLWPTNSPAVDYGETLLYVMAGVEGPVLAAKQLYAGRDFQGSDMPESARSRSLMIKYIRPLNCVFIEGV